ncbi:MAG TPA: HypC/HybG/HupF family hydrogenase formation chaperone [Acidimicrobiales bacterium]|nr:HypC/HybG/HupF family hydrogenase formation chaperone [Acidimicrobiales bacterium]
MCQQRLQRVVQGPIGGTVCVEDADRRRHVVSLLAYDGPPPVVGDWLVVHSGYALDRVDAEDAEAILAELAAAELATSERRGVQEGAE